ncbi:MAG: GNAT family N-acetyltransferase, partial [Bacteroidetes bacterium]
IIVRPEYQKTGIGKLIMEQIEGFLQTSAPKNAFIGLMAAEGVKRFYHKFGYQERPANGPGMFKRISK